MSPQKQRIAIAESVGWSLELPDRPRLMLPYKWHNKNTNEYSLVLPDYINDLNAMQDVEALLDEKKRRSYAFNLSIVLDTSPTVDLDDQFLNITAPSYKRAEAYLRTIGKWEE